MSKYYYPPVGYNFQLYFEGINGDSFDAGFQEAKGIGMTMETVPLKELGMSYMDRKLPGTTSYPNLELKRGFVLLESDLIKWCFATIGSTNPGQITTKTVNLKLLDDDNDAIVTWTFFDSYPVKWEINGFDAQNSSILVEDITIAYSHLTMNKDASKIAANDGYQSMNSLF